MRIAFSISVYEHAARLINRSPWEVSRDGELMYQAQRRAYETYRHFPVVVGIDIYNLEAEAYGGLVTRPDGNGIPAITEPALPSLEAALDLEPLDPHSAGRLPMVIEVGRRLARDLPDADVRIPVSGPFSIATSLFGLEALLTAVAAEPDQARDALLRLLPGQLAFVRAVKQAGLDIAFFESAAAPPLLSPCQFRAVELPALKRLLREAAEMVGHPVPCIIGGDTTPIVDAIMETGTDFVICPAETDRVEFLRRMQRYPEVRVRVNLDPRIYVSGSREAILREVDRIIALADGDPRIMLGTGALPYETPPENILLIRDYAAGG